MTATVAPSEIEPRPAPRKADVDRLVAAARALAGRKLAREKLAAELRAVDESIRALEERDIPAALRDVGTSSFDLGRGWSVRLEKFATGSVKEDDVPAAAAWMDSHGFGDLVKHYVTAAFGRESAKAFEKFVRDLKKRRKPIEFEVERKVHGRTLEKFVRERVFAEDRGEVPPDLRLPRDLFGVYAGSRAVLVEGEKKSKSTKGSKS